MTQVLLLTIEQKKELTDQQFAPDSFFNPVQDVDENWVISIEEMQLCTNDDFEWLKDLPLIDFKPIVIKENE